MRRELRSALKSSLQRLLQPLLFRQRNFTWNRVSGDFVDVIDVQWSSLDTQDDYCFTVNVGVVWRHAFETTWQHTLPSFVDEAECTVRARLGQLIAGKDSWWHSSSMSDELMVADALSKLEAFFLILCACTHFKPWRRSLAGVSGT